MLRMTRNKSIMRVCIAALMLGTTSLASAATQWTSTWTTSPAGPTGVIPAASVLRETISPRRAGDTVRLHLSNRGGVLPAFFSEVWIGTQAGGAALVPGSNKELTFGGKKSLTLQPGEDAISDPIAFTVAPFQKVLVSMQALTNLGFPASSAAHPLSREINYFSLAGQAADEAGSGYVPFKLTDGALFEASSHYIVGLDVLAPTNARTVVAFGDSITDGLITKLNTTLTEDLSGLGLEQRYPDYLTRRFQSTPGYQGFAVVNAGIAGNRLLSGPFTPFFGPAGLQRVEDDVLAIPGVTDVVIHIGINDLGFDPTQPLTTQATADKIIAGYATLVSRLHSAGLRVIIGTMMPARGAILSSFPGVGSLTGGGLLFGTRAVDQARVQINLRSLTETGADGFVDFSACTSDPARPGYLRPDIDSGDHLHPTAAGYQVMANCFDIPSLFPK